VEALRHRALDQAADGSYRLTATRSPNRGLRLPRHQVVRLRRRPGVGETWRRLVPYLPGLGAAQLHNTIEAIRVSRACSEARRKIIEAKANGDAVIDCSSMRSWHRPGQPYQSKSARAIAASPSASGQHLPHRPQGCDNAARDRLGRRSLRPGVHELSERRARRPGGRHDQYIFEAHRVSGESSSSCHRKDPLSSVKRQGQQTLSPFQRRLFDSSLTE